MTLVILRTNFGRSMIQFKLGSVEGRNEPPVANGEVPRGQIGLPRHLWATLGLHTAGGVGHLLQLFCPAVESLTFRAWLEPIT